MSDRERARVVVTGIGMVTPLGHDAASSWDAALRGVSGAAPITLFDTTAFAVRFACEVKNWQPERFIPKKKLKEMDRFTEFAVSAASMAVADANLGLEEHEQERAGCFLGVGLGGLLLKLAFLNGPYGAWMRAGLAAIKQGAEAA